jgi:DNA-binding transcriptional MerR regulator
MSATAPDFIRVGLTYRQIDYWTTREYLRPECGQNPGSGNHRRYPWSEVGIAQLMVRLTDEGIAVETAARIARDRAGGAAKLRRLADLVEVGS